MSGLLRNLAWGPLLLAFALNAMLRNGVQPAGPADPAPNVIQQTQSTTPILLPDPAPTPLSSLLDEIDVRALDGDPGLHIDALTHDSRRAGPGVLFTAYAGVNRDVHDFLPDAFARGARAVAMEVSSHALCQHRVAGLEFEVAVLTNLSRDHLDFHRDLDDYREAKARLFERHLA